MSWSDQTMPRPLFPITPIRQLDIGGEGRYPEAWNVNPRATKTLGSDAGHPIPNLIKGRAEAIPLPDSSVELILLCGRETVRTCGVRASRDSGSTGRVSQRFLRAGYPRAGLSRTGGSEPHAELHAAED